MNQKAVVLIVAGVAAYLGYKNRYVFGESAERFSIVKEFEEYASWLGLRSTKNLSRVTRPMLDHPNVKAMLRVIREGESGHTDAAYRVIVGGKYFSGFSDHPRIFGTPVSTAAGAYQITKTTWDWIRGPMGLSDFSPANQDFAALGLIAYRGALADVLAGNLAAAIPKLRLEWTSLPGAAENQRVSMAVAESVFRQYGGAIYNA